MSLAGRLRVRRPGFALDAAFEVPPQGITALIGASGAGKTTLLRGIAGLEPEIEGTVRLAGRPWQEEGVFLPPHRRSVGYVFQEASLFSHLSVRRNLEYGMRRLATAERRIGLSQAVAWLGLEPLLERSTAALSGGERQRVAIARALLRSPRLLLMDEPLASLDEPSKAEILPRLETLGREPAIPTLYVSHSTSEVARLADHLLWMEGGRIPAAGPVAEMLTRLDLPLAHGDAAEAVLTAEVESHDPDYQLNRLRFPGGTLAVAGPHLGRGRRVRLRVLARDVSLALERPAAGTSILNVFPAQVTALAEENPSQVMVRLEAGGAPLLSRITRKSADALAVRPGLRLYAQVKSIALLT